MPEGGKTTLSVVATYSDRSTKSVSANWSSSNPVVSVGATGALTVGQVSADTQVTLTASYTESGVTVTAAFLLTVKDVPNTLSYLVVVGGSSLAEGQTSTLTAKAYYTDGNNKTVTPTWSSSNSTIAAVSASGVVTTSQVSADSNVTIMATYSEAGVSKTALFPIVIKDVAPVIINTTPALASGYSHTVALRNDGSVWSWGWSRLGQSGSGDTKTRSAPVWVSGIDSITAISAGSAHNLALKADGTVWIWGGNARGQLGNRTTNSQSTPQAVADLTGVVAVAAGNEYTIVLKSDGSVWAAGDNLLGQLGDGSFVASRRFAPVQDADRATLLDLAPNQAKNPVPPDQVPIFYMNSEKSGDEVLSAWGSLSSLSLKSRIRQSSGFAADNGYQLFIAVMVPAGRSELTGTGIVGVPVDANTYFFKNAATNWETYGGGTMPAYLSNVAASQVNSIAMEILADTDLSGMSGAQFYVGYGTTAEEMVAARRYRFVYQVP